LSPLNLIFCQKFELSRLKSKKFPGRRPEIVQNLFLAFFCHFRVWVEPAQLDIFPKIRVEPAQIEIYSRPAGRPEIVQNLFLAFFCHFWVDPAQLGFSTFGFSRDRGPAEPKKLWKKVVFGGLSVWTLADCDWRLRG